MTFDDLVRSFRIQPDLNRQFWTPDNTLDPTIRRALLRIAKLFYDGIDLPNKPVITDIVFTGSLANYNYSQYSDVDLHLRMDFGDDHEILVPFFMLAKSKWNDAHDITIKGYDVEVYAEDTNSPHVTTGMYSVLRDRWIIEPTREVPVVDMQAVRAKAHYFIEMYKHLVQRLDRNDLNGLSADIKAFRDKLRKFRQAGLERGGEFSTENLTFKVLRRTGYMDKLATLYNTVIDRQLSVTETYDEHIK